jgi:hypothetical protein
MMMNWPESGLAVMVARFATKKKAKIALPVRSPPELLRVLHTLCSNDQRPAAHSALVAIYSDSAGTTCR